MLNYWSLKSHWALDWSYQTYLLQDQMQRSDKAGYYIPEQQITVTLQYVRSCRTPYKTSNIMLPRDVYIMQMMLLAFYREVRLNLL